MSNLKVYNNEKGVWRTIKGRHIFIKDGQSLNDALKENGLRSKQDNELKQGKDKDLSLKEESTWLSKEDKEWLNQYGHEKKLNDIVSKYNATGDIEKDAINLNNKASNYFYNKAGIYNESIDSVATKWAHDKAKELNESKIKDNTSLSNWREQVKANNEQLQKDLKAYDEKYQPFGRNVYDENIKSGYYELYRENERKNAKIKKEEPNEPYEFVEAYAGYKDKRNKLADYNEKRQDEGGELYNYNASWTGKEYTNDEFMEHLEDSNWHRERQMLIDAHLTNKELSYIKDKTNLTMWGVGKELTGEDNVRKMINEAKKNKNPFGNDNVQVYDTIKMKSGEGHIGFDKENYGWHNEYNGNTSGPFRYKTEAEHDLYRTLGEKAPVKAMKELTGSGGLATQMDADNIIYKDEVDGKVYRRKLGVNGVNLYNGNSNISYYDNSGQLHMLDTDKIGYIKFRKGNEVLDTFKNDGEKSYNTLIQSYMKAGFTKKQAEAMAKYQLRRR